MAFWFQSKRPKHPKELHVSKMQFLGEQDGPPERDLKNKLTEFFQRDKSVKKAYLARTAYDEQSKPSVALCLRTEFGPDRGLAEKVGKIFGIRFSDPEYMDIIFLTDEQESDLSKVCSPFFDEN